MTDNLQPPQGSQPPEFTYELLRQWEREWPEKIDACEDQAQVIAAIGSYKPWLDAGDASGDAFRGIIPMDFMQSVASWMDQHDEPYVPDNPVVGAFRELITSDEIKADDVAREKLRLTAFSTVPYINQRYSDLPAAKLTKLQAERMKLEKFCDALDVHPSDVMSRQRSHLHELTGRWQLGFDADGYGVDEFDILLDRLPKTIPTRSVVAVHNRAISLVTDSLALIAASGGNNAGRLWAAIESNKAGQQYGSVEVTASAAGVLSLAKTITDSINQAGGVEFEDETGEIKAEQLDTLPVKDMRYLPEAFRRLLYACIDMDGSVEDKDRLAADLDIGTRVVVIEKYAEKMFGIAISPQAQAVGETALKSASEPANEQPPRKESGKQIFRPQLFKAGHGKIS